MCVCPKGKPAPRVHAASPRVASMALCPVCIHSVSTDGGQRADVPCRERRPNEWCGCFVAQFFFAAPSNFFYAETDCKTGQGCGACGRDLPAWPVVFWPGAALVRVVCLCQRVPCTLSVFGLFWAHITAASVVRHSHDGVMTIIAILARDKSSKGRRRIEGASFTWRRSEQCTPRVDCKS